MTIEHKNIAEAGLHEPKGVSVATSGQVYIADGAGSGVWSDALVTPSDIGIERLLDGLSVAASQTPVALDTPLQIEFGPAVNTPTDPAMLDAAGKLTINETGTYRIKISVAIGRTGGAGVSELFIRALVNGVGAGQTIHTKISSSDFYLPYSDEAWLTLPAGTEITYEVVRDSAGNNSGGLFQSTPTLAGWAKNPSAALRVERWS